MIREKRQEGLLATAAQVARITGGRVVAGDGAVSCALVSTDSRQPALDSLFFALKGPNFDGAGFCADAVAGGARIVVVDAAAWSLGLQGDLKDAAVVAVQDPLRALGDLAAWHRSAGDVRVVGVTGSNGKTSTKEMIAAVLGGEPGVFFNRGNLNNLVGMPRSLLSLGPRHHHAVLEMGMNRPGEIARLAEIARPQIGVLTNVHPVHLEGLGSIHAIAQAKGELLAALPVDGVAVLNADDPYVLQQAERTRARQVTFGRSPGAEVRVVSAVQQGVAVEVELASAGVSLRVRLARPGLHNALNVAAAVAVGLVEGVPAEEIASRLARAPLPALRMELLELGAGKLLVDCYNANPRSVEAALHTLRDLEADRPRFAVLGDMRELGAATQELHHKIGLAAADILDGLCAFGTEAEHIARGAGEGGLGEVVRTQSVEEAARWAGEKLAAGGLVLLKGSRAMRLERVAAALALSFAAAWEPGNKE